MILIKHSVKNQLYFLTLSELIHLIYGKRILINDTCKG